MQQIEFIADHGDYETGDELFVDELSAKSLVERKLAKIVDSAPAAEVESGGDRARELNAQAAAEQAAAEKAAESGDKVTDEPAAAEPAGDDKVAADPAAEPAVAVETAGDEKAVETKPAPAATTRGRAK
ncbi:hypothetical protein SEA_DELRIO_18 [Gordonia phage DelRio]|nr:hypothetical protein SEA_DELRIO_18 [Gordonia phage DelRio]